MKLNRVIAAFALATAISQAAVINGSDVASNSTYDLGGWITGSNGGTPGTFGSWLLTSTGGSAGHFIGDSTTLSSPGANINTVGESFGMFGHSGQTAEAFRDFNGNTLEVGQTFSLDLAVNFRNGQKGFDLRDASDAVIFNFNIANDDYVVQVAATGNGSIGNAYSDNSAFALAFTQTSLTGGTWTITRSGGMTDVDSGTYSGVAENFKFYEANTTGGGAAQDNLYFNNLTVIPEPSSAVLGLIGSMLLLRRRK